MCKDISVEREVVERLDSYKHLGIKITKGSTSVAKIENRSTTEISDETVTSNFVE